MALQDRIIATNRVLVCQTEELTEQPESLEWLNDKIEGQIVEQLLLLIGQEVGWAPEEFLIPLYIQEISEKSILTLITIFLASNRNVLLFVIKVKDVVLKV